MNRGANPAKAIPHSSVFFDVAVLGNTTSAPTVPADGPLSAAVSTFPIGGNGVDKTAAGVPTRTSAGLYVITYVHQLVNVIPQSAQVVAAGASPTAALEASILSIVPATRKVTVLVSVPSTGAATDLGVNDMLVLTLKGYDTNSPH